MVATIRLMAGHGMAIVEFYMDIFLCYYSIGSLALLFKKMLCITGKH